MNVIIGIDPHEASHHAVVVDDHEQELAQISVRATRTQTDRLLAWATPFDRRTWAVEGAGGLGYLLSHQLVAVGETLVDVPATLAARPRVLGAGRSNKTETATTPRLTQRGFDQGHPTRCLTRHQPFPHLDRGARLEPEQPLAPPTDED